MDFSVIGAMISAFCLMLVIPPIISGILFIPIFIILKLAKKNGALKGFKLIALLLVLYLISVVGSWGYIYFVLLQNVYAM